jgi:hypothetical protein
VFLLTFVVILDDDEGVCVCVCVELKHAFIINRSLKQYFRPFMCNNT